jgi:glycosyltransferase involved in cell wall biosynthesis
MSIRKILKRGTQENWQQWRTDDMTTNKGEKSKSNRKEKRSHYSQFLHVVAKYAPEQRWPWIVLCIVVCMFLTTTTMLSTDTSSSDASSTVNVDRTTTSSVDADEAPRLLILKPGNEFIGGVAAPAGSEGVVEFQVDVSVPSRYNTETAELCFKATDLVSPDLRTVMDEMCTLIDLKSNVIAGDLNVAFRGLMNVTMWLRFPGNRAGGIIVSNTTNIALVQLFDVHNVQDTLLQVWNIDQCQSTAKQPLLLPAVFDSVPKQADIMKRMYAGQAVGFTWDVGGNFGYGKLGYEIASHASNRGVVPVPLRGSAIFSKSGIFTEYPSLLSDTLEASVHVAYVRGLVDILKAPFTIFHVVYNDLQLSENSKNLIGCKNVAFVTIEQFAITNEFITRSRMYDAIFVSSSWNVQVLRMNGINNVRLMLQGVDEKVFKPQADVDLTKKQNSNFDTDSFVIYSGGKLEYRKGQDIVLAAFIEFQKQHPTAHLIVNWENLWPQSANDLSLSPHTTEIPRTRNGRLDIEGWLRVHGLPPSSYTVLPLIEPREVARWMHEAHVGVFTNRGEGGTNLVAMEALSSG